MRRTLDRLRLRSPGSPGLGLSSVGLCALVLFGAASFQVAAQKPASAPAMAAPASAPHPALSAAPAGGESWSSLSAAQRSVLAPLQHEWPQLSPVSKQKWVEMAARYPSLPEADRTRIQARMVEWARMSPQERTQARMRFQQARKLTPQERHEKWQQYQSLPPVERQQLASSPAARAEALHKAETRSKEAAKDHPQAKSNVVPNDLAAAPPKTVSPSVVQAKPGATTNLMSHAPVPPLHQQPGLPKIAATPMLVDRVTLLPRRGSQGAGVREANAASTPASAPKRP